MSRRGEVIVGAGAAAFVFAVCALAVVVFAGQDAPLRQRGPALSATTTLDPSEVPFGDRITATVDVVTSTPARSVWLQPGFAPYRIERSSRQMLPLSGGRSRVRFTYTLSCLRTACAIRNGQPGRMFLFPAAQVHAGGLQSEADWHRVVVFSRTANDPTPAFRSDEAFVRLPAHPRTHWLVGLAAGLLLFGLSVLPWLLRRPHREQPLDERAHLRAALALALTVSQQVAVERVRAALEDVAVGLERGGRIDQAARVRAVAWSEEDPSPAGVAQLTAQVEQGLA
jgi:hypothetical protein